MRVYIAADSYLQQEVRILRDKLVQYGIEVTSRWIDVKLEAFHPVTEQELTDAAHANFDDIDRAVFLIAYNPKSRYKSGTGGRHVEMGYALAKNKYVLYVGEVLENVFHRHAGVIWVSDMTVWAAHDLEIPLAATIKRIWNEASIQPSER